MNKRPLVIIGSARKNGDTHQLVRSLFEGKTADMADLLDYKIYPYSYTGTYPQMISLRILFRLCSITKLLYLPHLFIGML